MLNIEILGVGGSRQFNLVHWLNTAFQRHDIEANMEYNNDIDTILRRRVEEVPALFINGRGIPLEQGFDEQNIESIILQKTNKEKEKE